MRKREERKKEQGRRKERGGKREEGRRRAEGKREEGEKEEERRVWWKTNQSDLSHQQKCTRSICSIVLCFVVTRVTES